MKLKRSFFTLTILACSNVLYAQTTKQTTDTRTTVAKPAPAANTNDQDMPKETKIVPSSRNRIIAPASTLGAEPVKNYYNQKPLIPAKPAPAAAATTPAPYEKKNPVIAPEPMKQ